MNGCMTQITRDIQGQRVKTEPWMESEKGGMNVTWTEMRSESSHATWAPVIQT